MTLALLGGLVGDATGVVMLAGGAVVVGGAGGYAAKTWFQRRRRAGEPSDLAALREAVSGLGQIALAVPDTPDIDSLAAAMGLRALCKEWGIPARVVATGRVTSEDAKAFCNLFDFDPAVIEDAATDFGDADGIIAVGGGGSLPTFGGGPPVIAAVRHRPATADDRLVIADSDDSSTATAVARLLESEGVVPDQRVATALLYGIRAGTREFRRVRGANDYQAAAFLHAYADPGRVEALRAPGMSGETFDVIGEAIANRERRASFAVTNVGTVPAVSALEEASDTLLRLDGVSSGAAFGVHDGTVVVSCRAEDVRTNGRTILETAFGDVATVGGNADVATARVPLGLFDKLDDDHQETLDSLIDASTRSALFTAFEST